MIIENKLDLSYITDKLTYSGAGALTDQQLLSVIIGRGTPKERDYLKAKQLLDRYSTIDEVINSPLSEVNNATQNTIKCCAELGRRLQRADSECISIETSTDAENMVRELLRGAISEEFWVICLNRSLKIIDKRCLFRGGVSSSVVDIKIFMKYVIDNLSSAVIIAHNHPSGSASPSDEDIAITKQIVSGLKLFDIVCFDHIISCGETIYSFRQNNNF